MALAKYWAVGNGSYIWFYDDGSWLRQDTGATGTFFAIDGTDENNIWAVGTVNNSWPHKAAKPLVYEYDGEDWNEHTVIDTPGIGYANDIAFLGDDVYVLGRSGGTELACILKYTRSTGIWSVLLDLKADTYLSWMQPISFVMYAENDIYITGRGNDGKNLYHWNGVSLTGYAFTSPWGFAFGPCGISGLTKDPAGTGIICTYVSQYDGYPLHAFTGRGDIVASLDWYEYDGGAIGHMNAGWHSDYIYTPQHSNRLWTDSLGIVYIGGGETPTLQGLCRILKLDVSNNYSSAVLGITTSQEEYYPCIFGVYDDNICAIYWDKKAGDNSGRLYSAHFDGSDWNSIPLTADGSWFIPYGIWGAPSFIASIPFLTDRDPVAGSTVTDKTKRIDFIIKDTNNQVLQSTVKIYIRGELVYSLATGFTSGWNSGSSIESNLFYGFDLKIQPSSKNYWRNEETVLIHVIAENTQNGVLDTHYSFFTDTGLPFKIYKMLAQSIQKMEEN